MTIDQLLESDKAWVEGHTLKEASDADNSLGWYHLGDYLKKLGDGYTLDTSFHFVGDDAYEDPYFESQYEPALDVLRGKLREAKTAAPPFEHRLCFVGTPKGRYVIVGDTMADREYVLKESPVLEVLQYDSKHRQAILREARELDTKSRASIGAALKRMTFFFPEKRDEVYLEQDDDDE